MGLASHWPRVTNFDRQHPGAKVAASRKVTVGLSLAEPKVPGPALRAGQVPHGAVPPLLKRNTIADFASTRAYQQASTTSKRRPPAGVDHQPRLGDRRHRRRRRPGCVPLSYMLYAGVS